MVKKNDNEGIQYNKSTNRTELVYDPLIYILFQCPIIGH